MGYRYNPGHSTAAQRLARNVRSMRDARGWSQKDLAIKLNTEQPRISEIESTQFVRNITVLDDLARAFHVDLVDLLRE